MSGYKNFAVAGAGNIGVFTVEELLKQKDVGVIDNSYILTRAPVGVDYSSTEGLIKALSPLNLDVLISTLGHIGTSLDAQWPLVDAVKAANIKLFVPSEFGNPTEGVTGGLLGKKGSLHDVLREKGVNAAYFYTGPFAEMIFEGYLEWDLAKSKVEAGGDGNVPVSYTARRDLNLQRTLQTVRGEDIKLLVVAIAHTRLEENPKYFSGMLQYSFLTHGGTVGRLDRLDNGEFPGWNPTKAIEFIARN